MVSGSSAHGTLPARYVMGQKDRHITSVLERAVSRERLCLSARQEQSKTVGARAAPVERNLQQREDQLEQHGTATLRGDHVQDALYGKRLRKPPPGVRWQLVMTPLAGDAARHRDDFQAPG